MSPGIFLFFRIVVSLSNDVLFSFFSIEFPLTNYASFFASSTEWVRASSSSSELLSVFRIFPLSCWSSCLEVCSVSGLLISSIFFSDSSPVVASEGSFVDWVDAYFRFLLAFWCFNFGRESTARIDDFEEVEMGVKIGTDSPIEWGSGGGGGGKPNGEGEFDRFEVKGTGERIRNPGLDEKEAVGEKLMGRNGVWFDDNDDINGEPERRESGFGERDGEKKPDGKDPPGCGEMHGGASCKRLRWVADSFVNETVFFHEAPQFF